MRLTLDVGLTFYKMKLKVAKKEFEKLHSVMFRVLKVNEQVNQLTQ